MTRALLALALLATLVAPALAALPPASSPPEAPAFAPPRLVASVLTAEPGIAVAPDGGVHVNVWSQTYLAATPEAPFARAGAPFDVWGDTDLAVDAQGRLHMVGMALGANPGPRLPYARSLDGGASWEAPRELAGGEDIDRCWVAVEGDLVVVTWNEFGSRRNLVRVSRDGGDTWGPVILLAGPFQNLPGPAVIHGSTILQPLATGSTIRIARSDDAGATWSVADGPRAVGRTHTFAVAAFDAAGRAYVAASGELLAASGGVAPRPVVSVWRSDDGGRTWGAPARVSPTAATAIFPWIVAGDEGHVAVAFYENALGTSPRSTGLWEVGIAVSENAHRPDARWTASRVSAQPIRLGAICTDGGGCGGSDWSMKDYFEMALTPEGRPIVAWTEDALLAQGATAGLRVVVAHATDGWRAHRGEALDEAPRDATG